MNAVEIALPSLVQRLDQDRPTLVCSDAVILGPLLARIYAAPLVSLVPNFATNEHVTAAQLLPGWDPAHQAFVEYHRRVGELFTRHQVQPPAQYGTPAVLSLVFLPRTFRIGYALTTRDRCGRSPS